MSSAFSCAKCELILESKYSLDVHVREVHQKLCRLNDDLVVARRNGNFKCPNCQKCFVNPNYLSKHFQTHKKGFINNAENVESSDSDSEHADEPSDDIVQPLPLKENNFAYNKR